MNSNMLAHEAVQRNLQTLSARGVRFVEPGEGYLACGWIGKGRLAEPAEIVAAAVGMLTPSGENTPGSRSLSENAVTSLRVNALTRLSRAPSRSDQRRAASPSRC